MSETFMRILDRNNTLIAFLEDNFTRPTSLASGTLQREINPFDASCGYPLIVDGDRVMHEQFTKAIKEQLRMKCVYVCVSIK